MNDLFLGLLVALAVVASGLSVVGLRRRGVPGATSFALLMAAVCAWAAIDAVEISSSDPALREICVTAGYVAAAFVPVLALITVGRYVGLTIMSRPVVIAALLVPAINTTIVVATNSMHHLMWADLGDLDGTGPVRVDHGAWFEIHGVVSYLYVIAAIVILARGLWSAPGFHSQAMLLVPAVVLPLMLNIVFVAGVIDTDGYDLTPFAFLVSGGAIAYCLFRLRFLDLFAGLVPVARDAIVEGMADGVLVIDDHGRVVDVNPAAARLLGISLLRAFGTPVADIVPGWRREAHADHARWEFELQGGPAVRTIEAAVDPLKSGMDPSGRLVLLRDITERRTTEQALKKSEERARYQARHDLLTGLPNRLALFESLGSLLERPVGREDRLALMILDLDGFKQLNDTFGHRAGDMLLKQLAPALRSAVRSTDLVARLGGDEFAVLLPGADGPAAERIGQEIMTIFGRPFSVAGRRVQIGTSIGVALAPDHGKTRDDLVHAADVAMYHAKRTRSGVATYSAEFDQRTPDRLLIGQELRDGIARQELGILYQPQVGRTGELVGVEALVRWRHPTRGTLQPAEFIPLAEETGHIRELTAAVFEEAVRAAVGWRDAGHDLRVSINLSALDLRDAGLPGRMIGSLQRHKISPDRILLEVTESKVVAGDGARMLGELRKAGLHVSLDDFGTGYASLTSLRELPVDELKIDRSFTQSIASEPRDVAVVANLIRLGHDLGLRVVAEGVEDLDTARRLLDLGADMLQGYVFGLPQTAIEITALARTGLLSRS